MKFAAVSREMLQFTMTSACDLRYAELMRESLSE